MILALWLFCYVDNGLVIRTEMPRFFSVSCLYLDVKFARCCLSSLSLYICCNLLAGNGI